MAVTQSSLVDAYLAKGAAVTDSQAAKDRGAVNGNKLRVVTGNIAVEANAFDGDGDVLVLCALHIDDVVHNIFIANDDLDQGTNSAYNLGLYVDPTGLTVKDEDCYATLSEGFRSARAFTDEAFEARDINKAGQSVWQDAGYSTRAEALAATAAFRGRLFLAITETATVTENAGDVAFRVVFSSDN